MSEKNRRHEANDRRCRSFCRHKPVSRTGQRVLSTEPEPEPESYLSACGRFPAGLSDSPTPADWRGAASARERYSFITGTSLTHPEGAELSRLTGSYEWNSAPIHPGLIYSAFYLIHILVSLAEDVKLLKIIISLD